MAIRNVDTEFWSDVKIADTFTADDKYFWLFLLTTRYGNLAGCFEMSLKQAQFDLGFASVERVEKLIDRFVNVHNLIDYDFETNEILIINWHKHNFNSSERYMKAVIKHASKIKNTKFKEYVFTLIDGGNDIGYQYGIDTVSIPLKDNIKVKVKDKVKDKEIKNKYGALDNVMLTDDEFEKLKTLFPNHYEQKIDALSYWLPDNMRKSKSHYLTIRRWLNNDDIKPIEIKKEEKVEEFTLPSDEELAEILKGAPF